MLRVEATLVGTLQLMLRQGKAVISVGIIFRSHTALILDVRIQVSEPLPLFFFSFHRFFVPY